METFVVRLFENSVSRGFSYIRARLCQEEGNPTTQYALVSWYKKELASRIDACVQRSPSHYRIFNSV